MRGKAKLAETEQCRLQTRKLKARYPTPNRPSPSLGTDKNQSATLEASQPFPERVKRRIAFPHFKLFVPRRPHTDFFCLELQRLV